MKTIRWFSDSPDIGDPDCLCSLCGQVITEDDGPAIRVTSAIDDREARFHSWCARNALSAQPERRRNESARQTH